MIHWYDWLLIGAAVFSPFFFRVFVVIVLASIYFR